MGDFDRNAGRGRSSRGRSDRGRSGGFDRDSPRSFGGRDRGRGRDSERSGGFGGRDRDRRSERQEMHPATCDKCGNKCEVPFRPTEGKPIYCDDCFKDKGREAGSRSDFGKPNNNDNLDQIHKKLDKILKILEGKKEPVEEKPKVKKEKSAEKEEPKLEYAQDIEKKSPKKKKAKKKKS